LTAASDSEVDKVKAVAALARVELGEIDTPLILMNLDHIFTQFKRWMKCLPRIHPYYAVKCNPDPILVAYLQSLGCYFDCATKSEMDLVVNRLGHDPNNVVFSNPCKLESHIRFAKSVGIRTTIIDNMDEIRKVKANYPDAQVLVRLACSDKSARSPMSLKFGATKDQVRPLLREAAEVGLAVVGVHFHVGSGCSDPTSYRKALMDARRAFDIGIELGHRMHVLDLGGGYPGLNVLDGSCQTSNGVHFEEMAEIINSMLDQLFPNEDGAYKIVAEPGRFFGQSAQSLVNKVMGKCVVGTDDEGTKLVRYYMTEGLYGTLSCIIFDQQDTLKPYLLREKDHGPSDEKVRGTMFGPTCDGFDKIGEVNDLPELFVGDKLIYLQFGAYTSSITTGFNGFDPAAFFYYKSEEQ
jgi:ornithine decarboxylase